MKVLLNKLEDFNPISVKGGVRITLTRRGEGINETKPTWTRRLSTQVEWGDTYRRIEVPSYGPRRLYKLDKYLYTHGRILFCTTEFISTKTRPLE